MNPLDYEKLSKKDFDAVVTGELTHYAIWLEHGVIDIITDYFLGKSKRREDFKRLILLRDGLTFQDKLEIARAMIPLLEPRASQVGLSSLLKQIENYKSYRNAFAHGVDASAQAPGNHLRVELVSRSGKTKTVEVTSASHRKTMTDAQHLLEALTEARKQLAAISQETASKAKANAFQKR
jgi:hypothetical protein